MDKMSEYSTVYCSLEGKKELGWTMSQCRKKNWPHCHLILQNQFEAFKALDETSFIFSIYKNQT